MRNWTRRREMGIPKDGKEAVLSVYLVVPREVVLA